MCTASGEFPQALPGVLAAHLPQPFPLFLRHLPPPPQLQGVGQFVQAGVREKQHNCVVYALVYREDPLRPRIF